MPNVFEKESDGKFYIRLAGVLTEIKLVKESHIPLFTLAQEIAF